MRGVRSLSGLAGPNASLKDAGRGGGASDAGIQHVFSDFVRGDPGTSNYLSSIDLTEVSHQAGDLMLALTYTEAWFDSVYGTTEVTTPGWALIDTQATNGGLRFYARVSDGTETEVAGAATRNGGLTVMIIRGVDYPDATDISNSYFASATGGALGEMTIPSLSDTTFDAVATILCSGDVGADYPPYFHASAGLLRDLGGMRKEDYFGCCTSLFEGPVACSAGLVTRGDGVDKHAIIRLGLRRSV